MKIGRLIKALEWWQSFSKNSHCNLDPIILKRELVWGIVNTCVKLYRNWIINEVARAMTKGEHTNERKSVLTYIRTWQTLYPLHNFVVRGDNKGHLEDRFYCSPLNLVPMGTRALMAYGVKRWPVDLWVLGLRAAWGWNICNCKIEFQCTAFHYQPLVILNLSETEILLKRM